MGRILRLTVPLLTILLAACQPMGNPLHLESTPAAPESDRSISAQLAYGYGLLADYDEAVANDPEAAGHFRDKAAQAASGASVGPDPATGGDTGKALGMLLEARRSLTGDGNNTDFAEAQLNYDCWVDRLDRQDKSATFCREKFYKAFDRLSSVEEEAPPAPHPGEEQHFAVYFKKAVAVPDAEAFAIIRQAAQSYVDSPGWRIHITGHAAGEKNKRANILLSMRRAIAVRNVLLQNGIEAGRMVVGAIGATGVEKGTPSANSVDIAIVPVDKDQPDVGPDITKIVPQYFGKNESD